LRRMIAHKALLLYRKTSPEGQESGCTVALLPFSLFVGRATLVTNAPGVFVTGTARVRCIGRAVPEWRGTLLYAFKLRGRRDVGARWRSQITGLPRRFAPRGGRREKRIAASWRLCVRGTYKLTH